MTNETMDAIIARAERKARDEAYLAPIGGAVMLGICSIAALFSEYAALFFPIAGVFALVGGIGFLTNSKDLREFQTHKAREIWKTLGRDHVFGTELSEDTRRLGNDIQKIYDGDSAGRLFPLRQSIRLIDTHNRQQQRLQIVENRLGELRALQENLSSKMAQLRDLGEDYPQGARNLEQINADLEALGRVHGQIRASCTRLEAIVIGVQKAVQSRQLRAELEGLSARVAPVGGAVEPAFEAESLEEIERQIGREIETYLRLERETDEHLR